MLEKVGGKLIGGYYTFGEYDVVIVMEAPNDEAVMSLMLSWISWKCENQDPEGIYC